MLSFFSDFLADQKTVSKNIFDAFLTHLLQIAVVCREIARLYNFLTNFTRKRYLTAHLLIFKHLFEVKIIFINQMLDKTLIIMIFLAAKNAFGLLLLIMSFEVI